MKEKFVYVILETHCSLMPMAGTFSQSFSSDLVYVFSSKKKAAACLYRIYRNSPDSYKKTFNNDTCSILSPFPNHEGMYESFYEIRKINLQ